MVVIDATTAMLLFQPNAAVPPMADGTPIERPADRVNYLVTQLDAQGTTVLLPTPALAEVLVRVGAGESEQIIERISRHWVIRIEPFDTRAAIEVAAMTRDATEKRGKNDEHATWAKLKYDRQIVAVAKVNRATTIYSDDGGIRTVATRAGIEVVGLADLPLPAEKPEKAKIESDKPQFELLDGGIP